MQIITTKYTIQTTAIYKIDFGEGAVPKKKKSKLLCILKCPMCDA